MILSFLVTFELSIRLNVDTVHDQGLGILRRKKTLIRFLCHSLPYTLFYPKKMYSIPIQYLY